MMVALLLYSYAVGERSSRRIERRCVEDVATRVICANQRPDHTTIARFRQRHESAVGRAVRRGARALRRGRLGPRRGDRGRRHEGARQRVGARDAQLRGDRARDPRRRGAPSTPRRTSASAMRAATSCRRSSPPVRAASAGCATPSVASTSAAPRRPSRSRESRPDRLKEAKRRLEEEHQVECRANEAYEDYRRHGRMKNGRRLGAHSPPKPYHAAGDAGGQDQPHRPGLAQRQDAARLGAGLQRPGGHHRGSDRHRRRGPRLLGGLRPARADDRRGPPRARAGRRRAGARGRARRRRLLAPGPDASASPPQG